MSQKTKNRPAHEFIPTTELSGNGHRKPEGIGKRATRAGLVGLIAVTGIVVADKVLHDIPKSTPTGIEYTSVQPALITSEVNHYVFQNPGPSAKGIEIQVQLGGNNGISPNVIETAPSFSWLAADELLALSKSGSPGATQSEIDTVTAQVEELTNTLDVAPVDVGAFEDGYTKNFVVPSGTDLGLLIEKAATHDIAITPVAPKN